MIPLDRGMAVCGSLRAWVRPADVAWIQRHLGVDMMTAPLADLGPEGPVGRFALRNGQGQLLFWYRFQCGRSGCVRCMGLDLRRRVEGASSAMMASALNGKLQLLTLTPLYRPRAPEGVRAFVRACKAWLGRGYPRGLWVVEATFKPGEGVAWSLPETEVSPALELPVAHFHVHALVEWGQSRWSCSSGCPFCGLNCWRGGLEAAAGTGIGRIHMPEPDFGGPMASAYASKAYVSKAEASAIGASHELAVAWLMGHRAVVGSRWFSGRWGEWPDCVVGSNGVLEYQGPQAPLPMEDYW